MYFVLHEAESPPCPLLLNQARGINTMLFVLLKHRTCYVDSAYRLKPSDIQCWVTRIYIEAWRIKNVYECVAFLSLIICLLWRYTLHDQYTSLCTPIWWPPWMGFMSLGCIPYCLLPEVMSLYSSMWCVFFGFLGFLIIRKYRTVEVIYCVQQR
jgi:hypothetical protein